ncbi:ArnT family glycosyltransferase [Plebeiibacterium marinum]|uniref:Glycosyltransferase family 39 protein n=1 Tax=Plebeiibacterium marinum TaxID=2992111 RepID=A0AAE3SLJ2_9BACT|nr:glycosyltransferase family 39 protein [Plebeiobacterium marinum]MCW3807668.1 glycosyltransferase family 39 protein [Plebeiobacterium marinum]
MQQKIYHRKIVFWMPVIISILANISLTRGITGNFYIVDEARNAECAREMLESGDYIVPTFNYELRTDKPPLHYYFMMISYSIFGVSEWSARFFSIVFGCLTVLICYHFTKRWLGFKIALWTAIVLLSSIHFSIQFHMAVPDPYLIFLFTSTLFLFFEITQKQSNTKAILMYTCMGLGTLAKGPVAIALPGLIMLLYLIFSKKLTLISIWQLRPIEGIIIVALVTLPWYLAVHYQTEGAWTRGFFIEHNIDRFSTTKEGHGGTFFIAPLFVLLGMLPFSAFFIRAIKTSFAQKGKPEILFSIIALFCIVGFFMVSSTRLPNYTAPAYPFFAIILGNYLAKIKTTSFKPEIIFLITFTIILFPLSYIGFQIEPSLTPIKNQTLLLIPPRFN